MKKIVICIFLTVFFLVGNIKSAEATMKFDIARTFGTISDTVKKYVEDFNNAMKQAQQYKETLAKGINLDMMSGITNNFRSLSNLSLPTNSVTGTKNLAAGEEASKAKARKEATGVYYKQWEEIAVKNKEDLEERIATLRKDISSQQAECNRLKNSEKVNQSEVESCQEKLRRMEEDIKEYEGQIKQSEEDMKMASKAAEKEDVVAKRYEKSTDRIKNDTPEEEVEARNKSKVENSLQDAEWDTEDALDVYHVNNDEYQTFMKNYFYDPNLMAKENTPENIGLEYENINNRITRNRKYLFINTAVHLMQVANTARREIPKRSDAVDAMFSGVAGSGELEADNAYGNTRVENARALLLYAKLLSAKLEYLAARDLLKAEQTKELVNDEGKEKEYEEFDLNKYILTSEYLEKLIKKSNETLDFGESN